MIPPIKQAIRSLEKHFSSVEDEYWVKKKERGVGAIYLSLNGNISYRTKPEIEELPIISNANICASLVLDRINPAWVVVVVEISDFRHERLSWQLLAIDERKRIRIFNSAIFGFHIPDTQTTIFIGEKRSFVEHRSPEGIESVIFSERGGEG